MRLPHFERGHAYEKNYGLIAAVVIILFSVYVYINTPDADIHGQCCVGPSVYAEDGVGNSVRFGMAEFVLRS